MKQSPATCSSSAWLAVGFDWAALPADVGWRHIMGAAWIGGVGFAVTLFITGLAFTDEVFVEEAKDGVFNPPLIAALGGYFFLLLSSRCQLNPRTRIPLELRLPYRPCLSPA